MVVEPNWFLPLSAMSGLVVVEAVAVAAVAADDENIDSEYWLSAIH